VLAPTPTSTSKFGHVSPGVAYALIGVGIAVFLALLAAAFLFWRRRRTNKLAAAKVAEIEDAPVVAAGQGPAPPQPRQPMRYWE
jgi:LPXTG-motif cell wall-anchored protein